MPYNIEIIRKNEHKTSEWSGGTTTELYIYPVNSRYSYGDFKWRLSSAKVQVESSTFTFLKGITRLIMVIEGELLLEHEGHHNALLRAFEQDNFSGEWKTTSFGKVIDFNLMMAKGYSGKLESISLNPCEIKDILLQNIVKDTEVFSPIIEAFYIVKGDIEIYVGINKKTNLSEGDLALVTRTKQEINSQVMIQSKSHEGSKIIKASIFCCE